MAPPNTFLLGSPDVHDPLGRAIMSSELVKGLAEINPDIRSWEVHSPGIWYPGRKRGISSLWFGQPGGKSRKISAFNYGAIPEFTQIAPGGDIIAKGWRAIFEKTVVIGAATAVAIEQKFKVVLDLGDTDTLYCTFCRREGKFTKANGKHTLCDDHDMVKKIVTKFQKSKERRKELIRKAV